MTPDFRQVARQVVEGILALAKRERKDTRQKRICIKVYMSAGQRAQIVERAGTASLSEWCLSRILLSEGFRDPIYPAVARALGAATAVANDLHTIGNVIRTMTKLRETARACKDDDPLLHDELDAVLQAANDAVARMLSSNEERLHVDLALLDAVDELTRLFSERETAARRRATMSWSRPRP